MNWRLWFHAFISLCNNGPQRGFDTYSPSIISSFGFPALSANALASVGLFIQVPVSFLFSWVSDRWYVAISSYPYILEPRTDYSRAHSLEQEPTGRDCVGRPELPHDWISSQPRLH